MAKRIKRVALLIETSREYGRKLLEGISKYNQEESLWSLFFEPAGLTRKPPDWISDWDGDGILARINDSETAERILESRLPVIDLRGLFAQDQIPFVGIDNYSVAATAFNHFNNRGFRSYALVGAPEGYHPHLDQRTRYFKNIVQESGFKCDTFLDTRFGNPNMSWEQQQEQLSIWVKGLKRNTAVLCVDDLTARETIDASLRCGLRVPEDLSVLGVDNDTYLCTLSKPELSSVVVNATRVGYEAARLLDSMMNNSSGKSFSEKLIPCDEIRTRQSTDIVAVGDPDLQLAMAYIHKNACAGIHVDNVVRQVPYCRSLIERKFKAAFGRSIHDEIFRVKLNRAQELLRESDHTLDIIAESSGFTSSIYLTQVFRKALNTSPGKWRKSQ